MIRSDRIRTLCRALQTLRAVQEQTRLAVVQQLEAPLESGPPWRTQIAELEARLAGHVRALDECLARLDGEPSSVREAVGAVIGSVASWLEAARSDESMSHQLRDVLVALSLARIEARMVRVVAEALDDGTTSRIAEAQAEELAHQLRVLEDALDGGLRLELEEAGKILPTATRMPERKVRT